MAKMIIPYNGKNYKATVRTETVSLGEHHSSQIALKINGYREVRGANLREASNNLISLLEEEAQTREQQKAERRTEK